MVLRRGSNVGPASGHAVGMAKRWSNIETREPGLVVIMPDNHPSHGFPMRTMHTAALCRRLYNRPGLGVGHFETSFGGRQRRRGAAPEIHAKAAGKMKCLLGCIRVM